MSNKKWLILGAVVISALLILKTMIFNPPDKKAITVEGTIVSLNTTKRMATLEFVPPFKEKKPVQMSSTIKENCDIQLDGKQATLDDLKVGDWAVVTAKLDKKTDALEILSVKIERGSESPAGSRGSTMSAD